MDVAVLAGLPQGVVAEGVVGAVGELRLDLERRGLVDEVRDQARGDRHQLAGSADVDVPARVLGRIEDRAGDVLGLIDRGRKLLGLMGIVLRVLMERRPNRGGLDEGDGDVRVFGLELAAQRVGEALDGVLGDRVHGLHRERQVGGDGAEVDKGSATLFEGAKGGGGPVHDAPEVGVEEAAVVFVGDLFELAPEAEPGVVDPCVEAAVLVDGELGEAVDLLAGADVGDAIDGFAAVRDDFVDDLVKSIFVARGEDDLGAGLRGLISGGETNAAGGSGNDDSLPGKGLECKFHGTVRADDAKKGRLCTADGDAMVGACLTLRAGAERGKHRLPQMALIRDW